jgi:hypothetical protein
MPPEQGLRASTMSSLNAVAVQLNGTPLATIAAAPMVQSAEYNALYHPTLSESYKIINASDAWTAAGGRATAGAGIKIGDIDRVSTTHILSSIQPDSRIPRDFPSAMRLIALRITRIRTAITSRKRLLLRKFSITKPRTRVWTRKHSGPRHTHRWHRGWSNRQNCCCERREHR